MDDCILAHQDREYLKCCLSLTLPKLRLSAGVGIAYIADISVYGTGENKLAIKISQNGGTADQQITGTLSGSAGVSAKAASSFHPSAAAHQVKTLQTGIYDNGKPCLVQTESGKKVLVYTTDLKNRLTGNHTAVVYSVLNDNTAVWSEPAVIDDDGTGDYYPSVAAKGDVVYITWTNASKVFTKQETEQTDFPAKRSAACEIEVAAVNPFTEQITKERLTKNNILDYKPSICNDNGTITVG